MEKKDILWLREVNFDNVPQVGGKNASLGEMYQSLSKKGINIPDGFALTTSAYWKFLKENGLDQKLSDLFEKYDPKSIKSLRKTGKKARKLILKSVFPEDLEREILKAYKKLNRKYGKKISLAVRSSGVVEDMPDASFAGQFETFLNVKGEKELLKTVKKCLASTFNDRVISYREEKNIDHLKFALSVGVLKMVRSDLSSSGIIFTLDTETGFSDVVLVNSIWGIGEMIVKGKITPDEFYVFKPTLKKKYKPIIVKNLGRKTKKYEYGRKNGLKEVVVEKKKQLQFSLTDKEIMTLARWAVLIENHYSKKFNKWMPQDIEWAKDGETGKLFIVQSRPETVHASKKGKVYREYLIDAKKKPLLNGIAVGDKIGTGKVKVITDVSKIGKFKEGEVLVTKMTDPDWVSIFPLASAIVTDEGGKTCFDGKTKILTNKGFISLKEVYERKNKLENLKTISLNSTSNKIVWRSITDVQKRKAETSEISFSRGENLKQNLLRVTRNHNFLTLKDRKIVKKQISKILSKKEGVLKAQVIPSFSQVCQNPKKSYLLGALLSDGGALVNNQGGYVVSFTQKLVPDKENFINTVKSYFEDIYGYEFKVAMNKNRENEVNLKCYRKEAYNKFLLQKERLIFNILSANRENLLAFMGGLLDGDGNISDHQIQITIGKERILKAVVIASLRLGLDPNICKRKNWYVVSYNKKFAPQLLQFSNRLNKKYLEYPKASKKKFVASQVIGDIINSVNHRGRIKNDYLKRNNMITDYKLRKFILPRIKISLKKEFENVLNSSFTMITGKEVKRNKKTTNVYNLTIKANSELDHNYIVFTNNYTPLIVGNCHAAIVSRELGIPAIVGTENATKKLKTGNIVTVDCTQGRKGRIFKGKVPFKVKEYDLKKVPKLKTKIMMNVGAPETAFRSASLPVEGIGLAREEFIIAEKIRVHPLALYNFEKLKDEKLKKEIEKITVEHKDKKEFFVKELAEGIAQIASSVYPNETIVRFSDFKTNEYRNLVGGHLYELEEANPMMGFRGASRYVSEEFKPAFEMECEAIKRVREVFGLKNVNVMIPFCRTVKEGKEVLKVMRKKGLRKGKSLNVYAMCEIPSNVILAEEFLKIFDGMSIGSNDLTQLSLGLDRDNGRIAYIGDETDPTVKKMISKVIKLCKSKGKYCGICGDAPSSIPSFAEFLAEEGIPSMSLSPDAVMKTILILSKKK